MVELRDGKFVETENNGNKGKGTFDPAAMDQAATDAENDLINYPDEVVLPMCEWWYKWFRKAGHKRLGRILVGIVKDRME